MKGIKVVFGLAAVALIAAIGCFLAFMFAPQKTEEANDLAPAETVSEESTPAETVTEETSFQAEAEAEVKRFRETYGMEIELEKMQEQLRIRADYEEKYGTSYEMEDIFILNESESEAEGDPGSDLYLSTIEKIQEYVAIYNIDESRYASMTAEEELAALEVEYGPLPTKDKDTTEMESTMPETDGETVQETEGDTQEDKE